MANYSGKILAAASVAVLAMLPSIASADAEYTLGYMQMLCLNPLTQREKVLDGLGAKKMDDRTSAVVLSPLQGSVYFVSPEPKQQYFVGFSDSGFCMVFDRHGDADKTISLFEQKYKTRLLQTDAKEGLDAKKYYAVLYRDRHILVTFVRPADRNDGFRLTVAPEAMSATMPKEIWPEDDHPH